MNIYKKDIFEDPTGVIAHGVNCQGVMGSGIAKVIRSRFPKAYLIYKAHCDMIPPHDLLGLSHVATINEDLIIVNCFTQLNYGRTGGPYADLDAIRSSLTDAAMIAKLDDSTFKMPMIGCGLGGLDWKDVSKVVEEIEEDVEKEINVYYI